MMYAEEYQKVKLGETIVFTEGAYSDFGVDAIVLVLAEFSLSEKAQEYLKLQDTLEDSIIEGYTGFVGWLIRSELVIPHEEAREIHLGDYGRFSDNFGELHVTSAEVKRKAKRDAAYAAFEAEAKAARVAKLKASREERPYGDDYVVFTPGGGQKILTEAEYKKIIDI